MSHRKNKPAKPDDGPAHRRDRRRGVGRNREHAPTVARYLDDWLTGRQTLRPSTRLAYRIHIDRYLAPHLGDIRLEDLTMADVEAMYRAIESESSGSGSGRSLSPTTVRRVHATLMSALGAAVRRGELERNPAAYVELRRAAHPHATAWSAEELSRFLDVARLHRLHPLFLTLATTGMRRGESLGLRWADVDLGSGVLRVEQQLVLVADQVHAGPPKSSSGRRTIAMPTRLTCALQWHAAQQRLERWSAGPTWHDSGLVFTAPDGRPLHPAQVSREFTRLVVDTDLPAIRLHDLRHTSASLGLASGETLLEVSRRLGHSSITITADIYSHITPATARESAERLADLVARATTPPQSSTARGRVERPGLDSHA